MWFRTNWTIYLNYRDVHIIIYEPEFRNLTFPTRQKGKEHAFGHELVLVCIEESFLKFLSPFFKFAFTMFFSESH